jgi:site-specific DNA-methyltransferase (adenine-specific)
MIPKTHLYHGDCLEIMRTFKKHSIEAIITDLPYGVSNNNWDILLDLEVMWKLFREILKPDGIVILTASGKFVGQLMMSNIKMFKYDLIWEKTINSGQLNVKKMPLRSHENILIFYNKNKTYNEQKTKGTPYTIERGDTTGEGYGQQKPSLKKNNGYRHARSIIKISNPRVKNGHPTQKPVELMEWLIRTYTIENDNVLDCCMGAGSTGIACQNLNRNFFGIEVEEKFFKIAQKNLGMNDESSTSSK